MNSGDMKLWRRKVARAFVYNPKKGLFLIVKSALPPFDYHLPGGGINRGESAENAMRRELQEELGITSEQIVEVLFLDTVNNQVLIVPHTASIFLVSVKDVSLHTSWEIADIKWMKKDDLGRYLDKVILKTLDLAKTSF